MNDFNWLLTELEFITNDIESLPINFSNRYFFLTSDEFLKLISTDIKIVWGVILAIPKHTIIDLSNDELPDLEFNDKIWESGHFQIEKAEIEIDCFDSSFTIVKFTNNKLSEDFKKNFPKAIELSKFAIS